MVLKDLKYKYGHNAAGSWYIKEKNIDIAE